MKIEKPVNPRKSPRQSRSQATVEAILQAAAHILIKDGYQAFNTNHVVQRAGVSIGSLYQYFPNKDALIAELKLQHVAKTKDAIDDLEFSPDRPLTDIISQIVRNHIALHKVDPELHHVLSEQVARLGGLDRQDKMLTEIQDKVLWMLNTHSSTKSLKYPKLVMLMTVTTVEAVTHNAMLNNRELLDTDLFQTELIRMILTFIEGAEGVVR